MIIYFISALLISLGVFKLGTFSMLITIFSVMTKLAVAILLVTAIVLLYRRFRGSLHILKLSNKG